jgi:hypothetical protein
MMAARLVATSSGIPGPGVAVCASVPDAFSSEIPSAARTAILDIRKL